MKNWWLYVLRREEGKYYVGITSQKNPQVRIRQHGRFASAAWTHKYKPVETIELTPLGKITKEQAEEIENTKTAEYVKNYGLENVRGGDIRSAENIIQRFGRIYKADDWYAITTVVLLILGILIFVILYFLKK